MERDEFIKSLGLGLALVCTGACFQACSKGGNDGPNNGGGGNGGGGTTANINLSQQLLNVGDYVRTGGVLFIRLATGNQASSFVATESICPHQGGQLIWKPDGNRIQCQLHFSEYASNGTVLSQPEGGGSTRTLKIYPVTINGTILTATVS